MKIVFVTDVIHAGGAETFLMRLAEQLKRNRHEVFIFVLHADRINKELKYSLAPSVPLITIKIPLLYFWRKIDGLLYKLHLNISFLALFHSQSLKKFAKRNNIDIIHSHLFTSDIIAVKAVKKAGIPVVTTMHGDYLLYSANKKALKPSRISNYEVSLKGVLSYLKEIVCITDEQHRQISAMKEKYQADFGIQKIYNGYSVVGGKKTLSRKDLDISPDSFVVGMVARGIRGKGWYELIEGFLHAGIPDSFLLLVGDGDFLQQLRKQYSDCRNIKFIGSVINPIDYIRLFDIACLTSYFENLPTVIIEYLFCCKPVIASNKGEVSDMLLINTDKPCGILVEVEKPEKMIVEIATAIRKFQADKQLIARYVDNTKLAIIRFDMQNCTSQYENVYIRALS